MSQILKAPPKFLPSEWKHVNNMHSRSAEAQRARSELLTSECKKLIEKSETSAKRMQEETNNRLKQRLKEIKFWEQELEQKVHMMVQEVDLLLDLKQRVERALGNCFDPLQAIVDCLNVRQKRVEIDLVHDEVDMELLKEKDVIDGVTALLQHTLEQIDEQIRLIRSAKYYLEKDLRDKFQAEHIDDFCSLLTSATVKVAECPETPRCPRGLAVSLAEWESFSDLNIDKAEKERNNSVALRTLVESLLVKTAGDMRKQHEDTCKALAQRIHETRTAKAELEDQLSKLLTEMAMQEKNLVALKLAISEKEELLKVAQTRLHARSHRPRVELCNDKAHTRLLAEVQHLLSDIARLKESVAESEMAVRALTRNQLILEDEIQVKANSLYIDEVICTQLLHAVIIHDF